MEYRSMPNDILITSSKFFKEVAEISKTLPSGQKKEFTCPICGKTAFVGRAAYNGHIHAVCECGLEVHQ